jgi:hypothetical protein
MGKAELAKIKIDGDADKIAVVGGDLRARVAALG